MEKTNDSYDAAVMRVLVQPLLDEDLDRFDEYNEIPYEYSETFNKKINRLFRREELRSYGRISWVWAKRAAICAMVGIMLTLASCAAVKPLREKIANAVVEWYTEYVAVYFEDETSEPILRRPTYIPGGYSLIQENSLDDYIFIRYADSNSDDIISFTCENNGDTSTLYDNERHSMEQIEINGNKGLYMFGESESNILTWTENGYVYSIVGYCDKEELLKMAESLK